MIYYIVPPIIIVISLSLLIWFIFRKVSLVGQGLIEQNATANSFYRGKASAFFSAIGHFFLAIAEWLMRRAKLMSLRFHNTSNDWVRSIRAKREAKKAEILKQAEVDDGADAEMEVAGKTQDVQTESGKEALFRRQPRERKIEPMVRREVTLPQQSIEREQQAKEKLEGVLIKRIAMNPRDIEAYERLGDYYSDQENAKDALECYRQVLKLSPAHHKVKLKIRRLERMLARR